MQTCKERIGRFVAFHFNNNPTVRSWLNLDHHHSVDFSFNQRNRSAEVERCTALKN